MKEPHSEKAAYFGRFCLVGLADSRCPIDHAGLEVLAGRVAPTAVIIVPGLFTTVGDFEVAVREAWGAGIKSAVAIKVTLGIEGILNLAWLAALGAAPVIVVIWDAGVSADFFDEWICAVWGVATRVFRTTCASRGGSSTGSSSRGVARRCGGCRGGSRSSRAAGCCAVWNWIRQASCSCNDERKNEKKSS